MDLKNLEEKAVEIKIYKNLSDMKIISIEGFVERVLGFNEPIEIGRACKLTGYQKFLHINLDNKKLLKFKGTSPVRAGDRIKAGLILDKYLKEHRIGNILYLGILKENGSFGRIDYRDGYKPTHDDTKKLGLP